MVLTEDRGRVRGTYGREVAEHPIEGSATADEFTFRYTEPQERGTGRFKLRRYGHFAGEYLAEGNYRSLPWQGWRGHDGLWDTHLGRLRFVQETPGRVIGFAEYDAAARIEGEVRRRAAHVHARGRQFLRPRRARPRCDRLRAQR